MRRKLSAILILSVFLSLQFGKIATYLYCKWQVEVVQGKPDCGCENHLTSMFDHGDNDGSKNSLAKITVTEKLNEFTPKPLIALPEILALSINSFAEYNSTLSESFLDSPFHPPIA